LQIRLTSAVNTATSKVDQSFDAVVIAPVASGDGSIAIASGVRVTGHIKELTQAVKPEDQANPGAVVRRLVDAAGKQARLHRAACGYRQCTRIAGRRWQNSGNHRGANRIRKAGPGNQ